MKARRHLNPQAWEKIKEYSQAIKDLTDTLENEELPEKDLEVVLDTLKLNAKWLADLIK